ncbi:WD repeat-containing protein 66, putative [Plasmodium chabaudi adami]|uniref:Cilia- and flagella-associated protein 251 n=1 Tax=Plasmodium chabaudi adami TaxID=5826 RepID=A0A1D3LGE7_PLACE|nr:WD repeat-containing protein 66, putative [Plasmodium chabaudi adami]
MKGENAPDESINLKFCYGINKSFSSVHVVKKVNEGKQNDVLIIYSSDNNIVMLVEKRQIIFRGHFNEITNLVKSYNNEYIVSCDKGLNSSIILWKLSNNTLAPIKKFELTNSQNDEVDKNILQTNSEQNSSPYTNKIPVKNNQVKENKNHGIGYECIDISFDNAYICALTERKIYNKKNTEHGQAEIGHLNKNYDHAIQNDENKKCVYFQEVIVFDVNGGEKNKIVCRDKIFGKDKQNKIRFSNKYEIVTNSCSKLYIYNFDIKKKKISHYSPSLYKSNKIHEQLIFTETSFVQDSSTLLTGTTNGYLIIWDYSTIFINKTKNTIKQREYQKSLEIKKNVSINNIISYGNFIILGLDDGTVQIFDKQLKCYAWFKNQEIGAIKSISFEYSNFEEDFFSWNSFILFTDQNIIKQIYPNNFNTWDDFYTHSNGIQNNVEAGKSHQSAVDQNDTSKMAKKNGEDKILLQFNSARINCICINPLCNENIIYIGNTNGLIEVFDFDKNVTINSIFLQDKEITSMVFSNNGEILSVGSKCGYIYLIKKNNFEIFFTSKDMKYEIAFLYFSHDDKLLVSSSANGNIVIYKNNNNNTTTAFNSDEKSDWKFAYKIISNNDNILTDLKIVKNNNGEYIIAAITDNRHLVFYNYNFSENTVSISYISIEQVHTPTCISPTLYFYNRQILCICNDKRNIRFFDIETKKIIKTVFLPFKNQDVKHFIHITDSPSQNEVTPNEDNKLDMNSLPEYLYLEHIKHDFHKNQIFMLSLNEKMIVFTTSPIDSNSFRYIGIIVCSGNIKSIIYKNQNVIILSKNKIFYFNINTQTLKKYIESQSNTMQIFIEQLGGEKSKIYNQIVDSFYYCEIQKKKFQNKNEKHDIKKILNILSIEYIFASINIFLSKFEIQNIIQEYHFYYKYVIPLLNKNNILTGHNNIQQNYEQFINHSIEMGNLTLLNYKSNDDILLQNIYFVKPTPKYDNRIFLFFQFTIADKNCKETHIENKDDENKTDITTECENIFFNINAFIYTYFNFAIHEEINFEKIIQDIKNYYQKKNNKTTILCDDFLNILNNYGENMDPNEFKRIYQIFTENYDFLNEDEIFDFDILQNLVQ